MVLESESNQNTLWLTLYLYNCWYKLICQLNPLCVSPPTGHVLPLHPWRRGLRRRGGHNQPTPDQAKASEWVFPWERQCLWIPNGTRGCVKINKERESWRTSQKRRRRNEVGEKTETAKKYRGKKVVTSWFSLQQLSLKSTSLEQKLLQ